MHPWRPIAIAGACFAGLALLFPFATFPVTGSLNGIGADAWPALIPLIPVVAAAAAGDWSLAPSSGRGALLVLSSCAALLFAIVKLSDAILAVRRVADASLGAGPTVLVGGALIALIGCVVGLSQALE